MTVTKREFRKLKKRWDSAIEISDNPAKMGYSNARNSLLTIEGTLKDLGLWSDFAQYITEKNKK